jgi:hypothetical protein
LFDTILIWGFVLVLAGFMGAGFFEVCKIAALIPAAFESSPVSVRNPMWADGDDRPNQAGQRRTTSQQRARDRERAQEQDR